MFVEGLKNPLVRFGGSAHDRDVNATRNEVPKDYLSRIKMAYLEEGATPSHRWYGWVTA